MSSNPLQQWFEMEEVRRRRLAKAVWIPLRQSETVDKKGDYKTVGSREDVICVGSVAVAKDFRAIGDTLGWMDIGLIHDPGPFAFADGRYKPADVFLHNEKEAIGIELVLVQHFNTDHKQEWLVNQDLIMALGLKEEGDVWVSPNEGYIGVIRRRRDESGETVAIEIRSEFLKDYLCARGLALRVAQYHQRMAILDDVSHIEWAKKPIDDSTKDDRFSLRVSEIGPDGGPHGSQVAVMKMWRTDVDDEEEVPVFGRESDDNTASHSYSFKRSGPKAYRAEGEMWREEWIEPAATSERIRGDQLPDEFFYLVGASGERLPSSALNDEDIGRWLWFRPQVIEALLQFRGAGLGWYTRDTGWVKCSPSYATHFGINLVGCINVYAYDIAKLPQWQQRIWVGHNVAPDSPVSAELMDSQMRATPAETFAPESALVELLEAIDAEFIRHHGQALFRPHDEKIEILPRVHRFRALEASGLLALAKDIARLTADSLDVVLLRQIVAPPPDKNWGSLKLLENMLATATGAEAARSLMTPLVGVYELRLGDAHLPSGKIEDAYKLVQIDPTAAPLVQATTLLDQAISTLHSILEQIPQVVSAKSK